MAAVISRPARVPPTPAPMSFAFRLAKEARCFGAAVVFWVSVTFNVVVSMGSWVYVETVTIKRVVSLTASSVGLVLYPVKSMGSSEVYTEGVEDRSTVALSEEMVVTGSVEEGPEEAIEGSLKDSKEASAMVEEDASGDIEGSVAVLASEARFGSSEVIAIAEPTSGVENVGVLSVGTSEVAGIFSTELM